VEVSRPVLSYLMKRSMEDGKGLQERELGDLCPQSSQQRYVSLAFVESRDKQCLHH